MLIYSVGTQVVTRKEVFTHSQRVAHPSGAVGVVVRAPVDPAHSYRIRFLDGFEASLHHSQLVRLSDYKNEQIHRSDSTMSSGLYDRVIFRCVIGSRAYGLADGQSDTDRRGVYLPTADMHWSLLGVPEQIENDETQECYWELQKFLVLALKANPNVLECLYSPIIEKLTPLGEELIAMRGAFLSRLVFQTYSGYVASQFKKMQGDLRNHGRIKWKHVMHLIRLLISGIHVLRHGEVSVDVGPHRDRLLAIKRGAVSFDDTETWRNELQSDFESALRESRLPDRPDYECANELLIRARRLAIQDTLP